MRIPVWPRGADPRSIKAQLVRRILSKSLRYAEEEVRNLRADWVDPSDPRAGIVPREFLPSGKARIIVQPASPEEIQKLTKGRLRSALPPAEVAGCKFVPPATAENPTLPRLQVHPLASASQAWDWVMEPTALPA